MHASILAMVGQLQVLKQGTFSLGEEYKLFSFIDVYHAPYTARNRYWTGLLLLARVILYLTAAINISVEPSVDLLAISLVIHCFMHTQE